MEDSKITKWYGKQVFDLATKANVAAMQKAAMVVEKDVKTNFTLQGSGKESRRGNKVHRASTKGQSPAIDTGVLRSSMTHTVRKSGFNVIGEIGPDIQRIAAQSPVGTDINYGLYLELGTSKMSPRPFLRPALQRTRSKVNQIFRQANK